jgi:hypothetical protein
MSSSPRPRQALIGWLVFIVVAILINGTIPFVLGRDLHEWTSSTNKAILFSLLIYSGVFLFYPLVTVKGWRTVRRPDFLLAVLIAAAGIVLWWPVTRWTAAAVVPVLAYLHRRFDLSELGFKSCGWKGDAAAILLMGGVSGVFLLSRGHPAELAPGSAFIAAATRMLGNPASTVENLFYFGFLTDSLAEKTGRWLTPILIGGMYTLHEMSNPEYWYSHLPFALVFLSVTLTAAIFLWRRSLPVTWLGDGLSRFITSLA